MNFNLKLKSFFLASIVAVAVLPGSTATPRAKGNLCGADVGGMVCNQGADCGDDGGCTTMLYNHVGGDRSFECYSYSGPCSIGYAGGAGDVWKNQDPSKCKGDTFFLWDEPVLTNGHRSMGWVVDTYKQFVNLYSAQLKEFRDRGGVITAPMWRAVGLMNIQFLDQCGTVCTDPGSPGYIGALAANYFGTEPSESGVAGSAEWVINDMKEATIRYPHLPVYITNWANGSYGHNRGACNDAACQLNAMKAAKKWLNKGWKVIFVVVDFCESIYYNDVTIILLTHSIIHLICFPSSHFQIFNHNNNIYFIVHILVHHIHHHRCPCHHYHP